MLRKSLAALALALSFAAALIAQDVAAVGDSSHKVAGLELPAPQEVAPDEGFVILVAECKGQVDWLVLSTSVRIKYKVSDADKSITVAVPSNGGEVVIFCVGVVDGKLTPFARTSITVRGPPGPAPQPGPGVLPAGTKLYLTIVESSNHGDRTPEIAAVVTSAALRQKLEAQGHKVRNYTADDPVLKAKGLEPSLKRIGKLPALIAIASSDGKTGKVVLEAPLPLSETEFLNTINRLFSK